MQPRHVQPGIVGGDELVLDLVQRQRRRIDQPRTGCRESVGIAGAMRARQQNVGHDVR